MIVCWGVFAEADYKEKNPSIQTANFVASLTAFLETFDFNKHQPSNFHFVKDILLKTLLISA